MTGELVPGDPDYRPARGYSWPPFEDGNTVAMRHGARSPRNRRPLETALISWATAEAPWLAESLAQPALAAWARAEAMVLLLAAWIDEHGPIDEEGEVRGAVAQLDRYERSSLAHRDRLGLDPRSHLAMLREQVATVAQAADLEAIQAAGSAALEARATETTDAEGGDR